MSRQPGQLDGSFNRFRTAVREECSLKTGKPAKLLRQLALIFVVIEIREMDSSRSLLANDLHDSGMGMSQRINTQSRDKIQIASAFEIVEKNTFPARQHDRITVIGLQQKAAFALENPAAIV